MRVRRLRPTARRTLIAIFSTAAFVAVTTLAPAQTPETATPTATPTPAAGVLPCTTFTTFDVHDGKVFVRSTSNPNDQGQEVHAGFAVMFACGALPVVTATQAGVSGLVIGGIALGLALGLGLGTAAAAGAFNGGGGGPPPPTPPVTGFR